MASFQDFRTILEESGAFIDDSHIVYASGEHGTGYIDVKHALLSYPLLSERFAWELAKSFRASKVQAVIGPATGGIPIARDLARCLTLAGRVDILSYRIGNRLDGLKDLAFDLQSSLLHRTVDTAIHLRQALIAFAGIIPIPEVQALYAEKTTDGRLTLKQPTRDHLEGKNVLLAEDVVNTGKTSKELFQLVSTVPGVRVVGLAAICNRSSHRVTAESVGVNKLVSLVNVNLERYPEADCPLCERQVPINTTVGHGVRFLARQKEQNNQLHLKIVE